MLHRDLFIEAPKPHIENESPSKLPCIVHLHGGGMSFTTAECESACNIDPGHFLKISQLTCRSTSNLCADQQAIRRKCGIALARPTSGRSSIYFSSIRVRMRTKSGTVWSTSSLCGRRLAYSANSASRAPLRPRASEAELAKTDTQSRVRQAGTTPRADHDPSFEYYRWKANLRILGVKEINTVPFVPFSHPFVERLVGTVRREHLDHTPFWNARDLERKLDSFQEYYNRYRVHQGLKGQVPDPKAGSEDQSAACLDDYRWKSYCRGLVQLPMAA